MPRYTEQAPTELSSSIGMTSNNPKIVLEKEESIGSEKQISVDPISLRESAPNTHSISKCAFNNLLPPLSKSSSKFMSCSLPNSATSSPRSPLAFMKHKKKFVNQVSPLARQHSVALSNLERLRENHLQRSKSCREGRVSQPSVDFDLWSTIDKHQIRKSELTPAIRIDKEEEVEKIIYQVKKGDEGDSNSYDDKFKCGTCLFLPSFGKAKTVRARKEAAEQVDIVSQRVSLEKFECGSWRSSSVIMKCEEDGDAAANLFFDLPVELIRCSSINDTESPVSMGFVFDNVKDPHHRKGVLKNGATKSQESCNSSRHVRFSTSSPTLCPASPSSACVTPRLLKARDDFTAFLEAQSA